MSAACFRSLKLRLGLLLLRSLHDSSFKMAGAIPGRISPSLLSKINIGSLNLGHNFSQKTDVENPFMKKYADKIAAVQNISPEEFERRMQKIQAESSNKVKEKSIPEPSKPNTSNFNKTKTLDSVMKVENLEDLDKDAIESLWKEYHKSKDGLYAILPKDAGKKLLSKSQEYPTFIFPLPRAEGYEFIMSQFSGNACHFTPLVAYQAHKENAPVCLTITYFSELLETKGLMLMRGEFDDNILKAHEAQCMTNQLHLYYAEDDSKKKKLLWQFNKSPDSFRHMDLIAELELSLGKG